MSKMDLGFVTSPEDLRGKAFSSGDRHLYKRSRIQTWQMLSESDRRGIFPTNSLFFVGWVEVTKPFGYAVPERSRRAGQRPTQLGAVG